MIYTYKIRGNCPYKQQENIGGSEVIHDAVMMGRVCHAIVDDVGDDKVFYEEIRKDVHMVHIHVRVHKGP